MYMCYTCADRWRCEFFPKGGVESCACKQASFAAKNQKTDAIAPAFSVFRGETGIRTLVTLSNKHAFQACALSHSATSPVPCARALRDREIKSFCFGAQMHSALNPMHLKPFVHPANWPTYLPECHHEKIHVRGGTSISSRPLRWSCPHPQSRRNHATSELSHIVRDERRHGRIAKRSPWSLHGHAHRKGQL